MNSELISSEAFMRIGVLSGGGDAPGLNAVIRSVTKTAIFKYGWQVTGIIDGFEGLLTPTKTRQLTSWNTRGILFVEVRGIMQAVLIPMDEHDSCFTGGHKTKGTGVFNALR